MKKQPKKLNLSKETVRLLSDAGLARVVGGLTAGCYSVYPQTCITESEMTGCPLCA